MWSLTNKLNNLTNNRFNQLQLSQVQLSMAKMIQLVKRYGYPINSVMITFCEKVTNSIVNGMNNH